jgi:hypothetical protein
MQRRPPSNLRNRCRLAVPQGLRIRDNPIASSLSFKHHAGRAAAPPNVLPIRGSGARPEVSQRIVKERPASPYIMILQQDRPTLSSQKTRAQRFWPEVT